MSAVIASLLRSLAQLAEGPVLRILLKSFAVTVLAFIAIAWGGWALADWAMISLGLGDTLFVGAQAARGVIAFLLALVGLWLSWRVAAMAVIQFFADEVVEAVEARHYPHAASAARDLSLGEQAASAAKSAGRALVANLIAAPFALALMFTAIGPFVVFWLVNALLLGRELHDMVWLRHRDGALATTGTNLREIDKVQRFLLGGAIAALLAVPFVNFLAPVLGAAAAAHLVHRRRDG